MATLAKTGAQAPPPLSTASLETHAMGARDGALFARGCSWHTAAAAAFTSALPPPAVAGAQSTRAYRDIKGWIAALVHAVHAVRWAALAAAVERAVADGETTIDDAACAVTRAIIERVVVRQPDESRRIVTSNARRQCARKEGRLSLIRLVDLALALAALRRTVAPNVRDDYVLAAHFWELVRCLRGLRAVHDMDSTARSIDLCLLDPTWALEHASDDAYSLDASGVLLQSAPGRATRTAAIIQRAVFRASRVASLVDRGPRRPLAVGCSILAAAFASDFDPQYALGIADRCVELTPEVVSRVRQGSGPLPLKDLRQSLFCQSVMHALSDSAEIAFVMQKLAQLFVPVGWHRGGNKTLQGESLLSMWAQAGNFSAEAVLGRGLAESGNMRGHSFLKSAEQKGDVAAPIVLGDLYRDGFSNVKPNPGLARHYYEIAISRGSALAALNLGQMFLDKLFPERRPKEAIKEAARLFQTSVDRGNARAALILGDLLFNGLHEEPRDLDRAERCYAIAADKTTISIVRMRSRIGQARVANERSEISRAAGILEGMLVEAVDPSTFAEMENMQQYMQLTTLLRTSYIELAQLYHAASAQGPACYLNSMRVPAEELRARACACCERAANLDVTPNTPYPPKNRDAWYMLGVLRLEMRDVPAAIHAFRSSMFAGHKQAPHNLGNLLLEQNRAPDAYIAFKEGAQRCDPAAAINAAVLAVRLYDDHVGAVKFYERAIKLGHAAAPAKLAQLLVSGRLPRDTVRARQLINLARQRGHVDNVEQILELIDAPQPYSKIRHRKRTALRPPSSRPPARRRRRTRHRMAVEAAANTLPITRRDPLWNTLCRRDWFIHAASPRYASAWLVIAQIADAHTPVKTLAVTVSEIVAQHDSSIRNICAILINASLDVITSGTYHNRVFNWRRHSKRDPFCFAFAAALTIAARTPQSRPWLFIHRLPHPTAVLSHKELVECAQICPA